MSKPTTKDLAQAAGVSLATVDRVLNGRPGVRQATIDRVQAAIEATGFVRDMTAATLARKKPFDFAFVLPDRDDGFIGQIGRAIAEAGHALRHERAAARVVRVPAGDPLPLVRTLERLAKDGIDGLAIMAPETPQARDAIQHLKEQGIGVVTFVSDQPNAPRDRFIGINDMDAGRTAATLIGRFCRDAPGRVLVVTETIQSRDSLDRRLGFDEVLLAEFPHLAAPATIETGADPARTARVMANALAPGRDLRAVYLMGSSSDAAISALEAHRLSRGIPVIAHELTPVSRRALIEDRVAALITQDVGHLVRSALRVLRSRSGNALMVESQERIRIEILLRTNLPRAELASAAE